MFDFLAGIIIFEGILVEDGGAALGGVGCGHFVVAEDVGGELWGAILKS